MALGRNKEARSTEKWLEVDASMTGSLAFRDPVNLQINGRFEGNLDTRGKLSIGEKAQVKANIQGESITIAGLVEGVVIATSRVELLGSARVTGKVVSPQVVMQQGAVLHGQIEMLGLAGNTLMTVEELARYLEVEISTVNEWALAGRLPAERQGDTWRFERAKIEEWLAHEKIK